MLTENKLPVIVLLPRLNADQSHTPPRLLTSQYCMAVGMQACSNSDMLEADEHMLQHTSLELHTRKHAQAARNRLAHQLHAVTELTEPTMRASMRA